MVVIDNVNDVEILFPSRQRWRSEADASAQTPLATYLPQRRNRAILAIYRSKDAAV
ncbi:hypothetical protein PMIN01_08081 [Paraphaeosphaeria minitans]|uniref:Uncharacterized protein n=1 Tax=Paraphaeosphaeria minitans TaxID=565426 RepID=A0A9P6GER8_9PLEO|nr:hypothetical protein PMIN01_08081 [Paraphaeosphaeria minitans]